VPNFNINLDGEDLDCSLDILGRALEFGEFVYNKMFTTGAYVSLEDFQKYFPNPVEDFGNHPYMYYDIDSRKMKSKIASTQENWENGTLGADIRYARVVELPESMTAPFSGKIQE
jgi:hypothetical protein